MTKEVLEQYIDLKKEINSLEKRIIRLEKKSTIVSDIVQNGYKRHAVIRGVDYDRLDKLDDLINILKRRKKQALEQEIEISNFIMNIPNVKLRRIFEYKYIDNMTWPQIQIIMRIQS